MVVLHTYISKRKQLHACFIKPLLKLNYITLLIGELMWQKSHETLAKASARFVPCGNITQILLTDFKKGWRYMLVFMYVLLFVRFVLQLCTDFGKCIFIGKTLSFPEYPFPRRVPVVTKSESDYKPQIVYACTLCLYNSNEIKTL